MQNTRGSGCGSVGRAVASNTRGPRFESRHGQILKSIYLLSTVLFWKDENKGKRGREWSIFWKKNSMQNINVNFESR